MEQIRQGDVLLIRRPQPRQAQRIEAAGLRVPGERTGHAHILEGEVLETPSGTRLIHLEEDGEITHPEHGNVPVPAGYWEPVLQREFVPSSQPANRANWD